MKTKVMLILTMIMMLSISLVTNTSAQETNDNIVDVLAKDNRFETVYEAVLAAGLANDLASADNSYTVFAPRNSAFARLVAANPGALDILLADPEGLLTDILLYHVVPGKLMSSDVAEATSLTTLQGGDLAVLVAPNGSISVNGAQIVEADIPAKNGVIHIIDGVLLPQDLDLPEVPATAVETNPLTIAEVLAEDGRFTSLLNALEATDLADVFAAPGDYTLFAPTDEAFESIGELELSEAQLKSILLYHVVGDSLTRDQLATDDLVPTLSNGRPIFVNREGPNISNLSGAEVESFNINASNGIIHVIDEVMIP